MAHGPCTIQITYNDPDLGPLALGGLTGVDQAIVSRTWLRLGGQAPSGRNERKSPHAHGLASNFL